MIAAARPTHGPVSIVGRERELQSLREAFDWTTSGTGGTVVVSGDAGIGKSTLISALIQEQSDRALALVGRCHDLRSASPFEPWAQIVDALNRALGHEAFDAEVFQGRSYSDLALVDAIFGHFLDVLAETARNQPLIVVLEDLQWADSVTLDLIQHIAPRIECIPILLILSYRSDEVTRRDPLFTFLPGIIRDGNSRRIKVKPLEEAAISQLVESRYDLSEQDRLRLVNYVHAQSEGNPFYLTEILRFLEEEGVLFESPDGHRLGSFSAVGVPPLLQQVIEVRLQRLTDADRQILNVAAIFGHEVAISVLRNLTGADPDTLMGTLARAAERGILTDTGGTTVCFSHALIRETLYESTHPPERRIWHRRIAELLARVCAPDPDQVAHHFGQAGDPREAAWLVRSGNRAMKARARTAAAERYERALQLLENEPGKESDRAWLLYHLGAAYRIADPRRSLAYFADASAIAATLDDPALKAIVQLGRGLALCSIGHPNALDEFIKGNSMIENLSTSDQERLKMEHEVEIDMRHSNTAYWLASYGRYDDAEAAAHEYLATAASLGETGLRAEPFAWYALAKVSAARGRADEARAAYSRAAKLFDEIGNYYLAGNSHWEDLVSVSLVFRADQPEDRREQATAAGSYWSRSSSAQGAQNPDWCQAPVLYVEGKWDEAWNLAINTIKRDTWSITPLVYLGRISHHRGEIADAWSRVWAGIPEGPNASPGSYTIRHTLRLQILAVYLALVEGNRALAVQWLESLESWMEWSGTVVSRTDVELLKAHVAHFDGDVELASDYAQRAIADAKRPYQPLALLRAYNFHARLLAEMESNEADKYAQRALAQAEACGALFERAQALTTQARIDLKCGKYARASGFASEARQIFTSLRAKPALRQLEWVEQGLRSVDIAAPMQEHLTPRQAEILWLVAQGLTDNEIATRLRLSKRTVSNHLQSIYGKLGVNSRAAATRHAIEHNLI